MAERSVATSETLNAAKPAGAAPGRAVWRMCCSYPVFLGALLVGAVFIATAYEGTAAARLFTEGDTWWHAAVGRQILASGRLPTVDTYSFTVSGNPWMACEWLGEIAIGFAAQLAGLRGLAGLLLLLAAAFFVLLYHYCWLRSANAKAAFAACAVVLPLASEFFTLRPQLLGYIFLLITLICLERFRQGKPRAVWMLPGLFLVWVNTHGTFVLGLLAVGLYWMSGQLSFERGGLVAERWTAQESRQLALVALLGVLALPCTPYGTRVAAYPLEMAFSQPVNVANIFEWSPLPFDLPVGKLFLAFLLAFLVAQLVLRPKYRVEEFALLVLAIYASCVHRRFAFLFVAVFTPVLARLFSKWLGQYDPTTDRPVLNGVLAGMIAVALAAMFPSQPSLEKLLARKFPSGAVQYLRQGPAPDAMLNEYGWGGYLIWALSPGHKVFIDGRTDIYEHSGVFSDYLSITRLAPDTVTLLRKYDIDACLLERHAPLGTLLKALPDWTQVYADTISVVFVRKARIPAPVKGVDVDRPRLRSSRTARSDARVSPPPEIVRLERTAHSSSSSPGRDWSQGLVTKSRPGVVTQSTKGDPVRFSSLLGADFHSHIPLILRAEPRSLTPQAFGRRRAPSENALGAPRVANFEMEESQ